MRQEQDATRAEGTVRSSIVDFLALEDRARDYAARDARNALTEWVSSHCYGHLGMEALVHLFERGGLAEMIPSPLNGEWAGQSMWEVLGLDPSDFTEDDTDEIGMACDTFDSAYTAQWLSTVNEEARRVLESEVTSWKYEINSALFNASEHLKDIRAWFSTLHVEQDDGVSALDDFVRLYGKYVHNDRLVQSMTDALAMLDRFNKVAD